MHPSVVAFKEAHRDYVKVDNHIDVPKYYYSVSNMEIEAYPLFLLTDQKAFYAMPSPDNSILLPETRFYDITELVMYNLAKELQTDISDFAIMGLYDSAEKIKTGEETVLWHGYDEKGWEVFCQCHGIV